MKKLAIIGGSIFSLGIIIFIIALGTGGWDFANLSSRPPFEEKQYLISNDNQTIILNDSNIPILVGLSNDDQIHFICFEREKESYSIDGTDVIKIERKSDYKWYDKIFVMDFQAISCTLLLPVQFNGSLDLITSNGKITLSDVTAKNIKLTTSNSGIYLNDISAHDISAHTTNGKIVADSTESTKSIGLKTYNASIEIQDISAGDDILLATSNGKISGNIMGKITDYSITSQNSNASNNLPESSTGGDKNLKATTINGEIAISFIE